MTRGKIRAELLVMLAVTFGMSGLRSALRLVDALLQPEALNQQQVTLNGTKSAVAWLDIALQFCSAGVLFAWGGLALYLLWGHRPRRLSLADAAFGPALAALIGIPGLVLYVVALQQGWTKEVVPGAFDSPWVEVPAQLVWSAANAFGEEVVVVFWLCSRLSPLHRGGSSSGNLGQAPGPANLGQAPGPANLGWAPWVAIGASAVLRGSYHLYQGVSAGFGNVVMGVVFAYFYYRTGRLWPLVIAHFLIDAIAFVGYALLGDLSFMGV